MMNSKYSSGCKHDHKLVKLLWLFTQSREQQILKYCRFLQDINFCSTVIKCGLEYESSSLVWLSRLFEWVVRSSALCCFRSEWARSQNNCVLIVYRTSIHINPTLAHLRIQLSSFLFLFLFLLSWIIYEVLHFSELHTNNFNVNTDTCCLCCPRATNLIRECCAGNSIEIKYPFRETSVTKITEQEENGKLIYMPVSLHWLQRSVGWLVGSYISNWRHLKLSEIISPV